MFGSTLASLKGQNEGQIVAVSGHSTDALREAAWHLLQEFGM